jgi:hypothetical protein
MVHNQAHHLHMNAITEPRAAARDIDLGATTPVKVPPSDRASVHKR